jgi:hypothetical protein
MSSAFTPYNTLPVADEALDKGGTELLRAGLADKRLFVSLHRNALDEPERWGEVLAEITLNLAVLFSSDGMLTEDFVIAAVAGGYRDALRNYLSSEANGGKPEKSKSMKSKPVKSAKPGLKPVKKAKAVTKSKAPVKTPAKVKAKSKPAGKVAAGGKVARR